MSFNAIISQGASSETGFMTEDEIASQLIAERERLEQAAGLVQARVQHFRRPVERPFTAEERQRVTILFGGLTWKHEKLIEAVFPWLRIPLREPAQSESCRLSPRQGIRKPCPMQPDLFHGGQPDPVSARIGSARASKQEILDNYVFFTAGSCGPCRFGMYESEYRMALDNAGFGGFRVLLFSQDQGIKAKSGEPGLEIHR